jgi:uncharacterized membrane protein YkgB
MTTLEEIQPVALAGRIGTSPERLEAGAGALLRWGLVGILLWFGAFKFTAAEAMGIQPLVSHSPLTSWLYHVTDVRGASRLIGCAEIAAALLMAARPWRPGVAALGSLLAAVTFLTTLSFLASTPGAFERVEGFLVPSATGSFLIKDVFLLGAALWSAGEALRAYRERRHGAGGGADHGTR